MKGGGLLSEGGYGCVYHPSLTNKGKDTKKKEFVSKLQIQNLYNTRYVDKKDDK